MSTVFPNAVQEFKQWEDLTSEQLTAYIRYINALNQGQWAQARDIFSSGGLSPNMLPTAKDFNEMCDTILECKALYEAQDTSAKGIQDFMGQFTYMGEFNANSIAQYKKFTLIKFENTIYMAVVDITSSNAPSINTSQWIGIRPVSYSNSYSTYRGVWVSTTNYVIGDVVVYNNAVYIAVVDNYNQTPSNNINWQLIINFNNYIAQLSPTPPENMPVGGIWFKTLA